MASVLGAMTCYVVKSKRTQLIRKRQKSLRWSGSNSWYPSDFSNSEKMRLYCNHKEEATSISDEEMVDGDANIDEEMVDANIGDEDVEMVDANIDD
ncbi:hypothetical protein Sjap_022120 [Stephania japonica]|uniref:Uncharacterized protein n=1 Tax=Stephania japonica TaxID=461633 RepID=A0AAP0EVI2_9MAGN